ncbi:acyltransferase [Clostridium perfringens]|uniref:acyltransferase n=2 Tax=Clostridium perfringens TaxID=1502 RepID=UPI0013E3A7CC|nr:acyltransferase [Clostridium perfringens]MCX0384689.1 acyltransferase [Clostridium perfringens]MCX0411701.1 acyltransferase [Clostridium perfringens]MDT7930895.1 acyltransferase [Clostridium perfringens]MDT7955035.1 acyltransferase [Clostridium perfringens]
MKKVNFLIKKWFYEFILRKDSMHIKVDYYRSCGVKIGENMRAFSTLLSAEPYLLNFGDNITVSTGVKFITHDNSVIKVLKNSTDYFGEIIIGNNCFIGQNSIILPGVTLANNTIVGAGSVVTKSFRSEGCIIAGNPARVIGDIENYKIKVLEYSLNTKNMTKEEKKNYILSNRKKLIKR